MKTIGKKIFAVALLPVALISIIKIKGDDYMLKGLWASYLHGNSSATIDDAKYFKTNIISTGETVWEWPISPSYNQVALSNDLNNILSQTNSTAFLIIRNDSILDEYYWDGYTDSSLTNSFSMAKSITTMLAHIAIQKGLLKGWNQKVKEILPELEGKYADSLQLWHLSTMSSGMEWDEAYKDPFSITAKSYYGADVAKLVTSLPIIDQPGKFYNYQSGSTQLLGLCILKVSGQSLAELASNWLWKPMQAKHAAKWHTDDSGTDLAFCCFNSNARDFARFGKLMLNMGNWNGTQILDSAFVSMATKGALVPYYGYSFWLDTSHGTPIFYQRGILGQYIINFPEYNAIIVRLGHQRLGVEDDSHSTDYHVIVREVLKRLKPRSATGNS